MLVGRLEKNSVSRRAFDDNLEKNISRKLRRKGQIRAAAAAADELLPLV